MLYTVKLGRDLFSAHFLCPITCCIIQIKELYLYCINNNKNGKNESYFN